MIACKNCGSKLTSCFQCNKEEPSYCRRCGVCFNNPREHNFFKKFGTDKTKLGEYFAHRPSDEKLRVIEGDVADNFRKQAIKARELAIKDLVDTVATFKAIHYGHTIEEPLNSVEWPTIYLVLVKCIDCETTLEILQG